jgi:ribonuclease R
MNIMAKEKNKNKGKEKKSGKKKANSAGTLTKKELVKRVVHFFQVNPSQLVNYKQVAFDVGAKSTSEKQLLMQLLEDLVLQEFLVEPTRGKYRLDTRSGSIVGTLERRAGGKVYLVPEDGSEDVFIMDKYMNKAIVGDVVRVRLFARRRDQMQEGQVLEVIQRGHDTFVGKIESVQNYAFLVVDNRLLNNDIFIPAENLKGAKNGDKAIVKIIEWSERDRNPVGEVVEVLGATGDNDAEMNAILVEFGLPYSYPKHIESLADEIPEDIPAEEIEKRVDCRDIPTFTIDPADAKDFDDALSIRRLSDSLWEVGVHIADVTYYVKQGDTIDEEAFKRATSVYLVDRTIPMLPERLSNRLCSLRTNEDKCCFSVLFKMDDAANVKEYQIVHTIINSDRRFTYEEAQTIMETEDGEMKEEILALDRLAKQLRENRFIKGAIAFERTEVRFEIDEKGKPLSVYFKESKDANKLIEEFMLLANLTVAEFIGKNKNKPNKTFV